MKKRLVVMLAFFLTLLFSTYANTNATDINGHWAQSQIEKAMISNMLSGYLDGSFKPDKAISRAEFVTIIKKAKNLQVKDKAAAFSDIKESDWYYESIICCYSAGLITGYPDGTFRPNQDISREEAAVILFKLLKLNPGGEDVVAKFQDANRISEWSKSILNTIVANKIMSGYPNGTFQPQKPITRAEAIVTMQLVLAKDEKPEAEHKEIIPVETEPVTGGEGNRTSDENIHGQDATPPILKIISPQVSGNKGPEVLTPFLNVAASAKDENGLLKISYCLTNVLVPEESYVDVFSRDNHSLYKQYNIKIDNLHLEDGNNCIKIVVKNIKGLQTTAKINVNYKGPSMKELDEAKIADIEGTGLRFVTDQILITAKDGVTEDQIMQLIQAYDGTIVGCIPLSNDYQIEIQGDLNLERLKEIVSELEQNDLLESVSLHYVFENDANMVTPNDARWAVGWSETEPDGINWGVEAIKAPSAWDHNFEMQLINVGLIDTMFDINHADLNFTQVFNNPQIINDSHGTHVAGTMAATCNNAVGITGIVWNKDLYGFSMFGNKPANMILASSEMQWKYALAQLLVHNVKVINVSMGNKNSFQFAALNRIQIALDALANEAKSLTNFLQKMLNKGFDFVIVQAAGNASHKNYIADNTNDWGFREADPNQPNAQNTGWLDTTFAGTFTNITDQQLQDRIIIVGAVKNEGYRADPVGSGGRIFKGYSICDFSQIGQRVDIMAPGENISSTVPNNNYQHNWNGTSMAAPHVTGTAAMVWAINPGLTGAQVKSIVVDTADRDITLNNRNYPILNAQAAVDRARSEASQDPIQPVDTGVLMGTVLEKTTNKRIDNAQISVFRQINQNGLVTTDYTASTRTNVSGEFELILPGGQYSLNINATGYLPFQTLVQVSDNTVVYIERSLLIDNNQANQAGTAGGTITNAFDGSAIPGVSLKFRPGWNNTSGEYVENNNDDLVFTTDDTGYYEANLTVGNYTVEASKSGYITGYFNNIVLAIDPDLNQHAALTPVLPEGQTRIVLTWGETPFDLDSHLTGPKLSGGRFHTYFHEKSYQEADTKYADLDYDDVTSYGPETTTIYTQIPGTYRFSIHDYTNRYATDSNEMSLSGAQVKVYRGNERIMTFNVPGNQVGTVWTVFEINGDTITPINSISNESNPAVIQSIEDPALTLEDTNLFLNLPKKLSEVYE